MLLPIRLHDALDRPTVLRRLLPVLAGGRGRRACYAAYDPAREQLVARWAVAPPAAVEELPLQLDPARIHGLLVDDAGGDRPVRPIHTAPRWVLNDLFPGLEADRYTVVARAISHQGKLLGVLALAEPRRVLPFPRGESPAVGGGDVLELALARILAAEIPPPPPRTYPLVSAPRPAVTSAPMDGGGDDERIQALERATAGATELLMDAHVELDRRAARHQRQTRLLFLLRGLMERSAAGREPADLAADIVQTVGEAFGGGRCSLFLVDERTIGQELRLGAAIGLPPQLTVGEIRVSPGRGISGEVALSRTARVVRDRDEGSRVQLLGDDWYTSDAFVSLPLVCGGRLLGVLNLTNFRSGTVDDTEVEQLRLVSVCVALLADHARLGERLFGR
jgi:putative methionine-R-sulfoxide reductase with GAF domain